jgi:hypothetical protein
MPFRVTEMISWLRGAGPSGLAFFFLLFFVVFLEIYYINNYTLRPINKIGKEAGYGQEYFKCRRFKRAGNGS